MIFFSDSLTIKIYALYFKRENDKERIQVDITVCSTSSPGSCMVQLFYSHFMKSMSRLGGKLTSFSMSLFQCDVLERCSSLGCTAVLEGKTRLCHFPLLQQLLQIVPSALKYTCS